jgi:Ribbon-helix-helix protein, copG family
MRGWDTAQTTEIMEGLMAEALAHERTAKLTRREEASEPNEETKGPSVHRPLGNFGSSRKKKLTISLSQKSLRAFEELREATDADTDSEVFRNALRLHLTLLRAYKSGVKLFMKRNDSEESVPVTLFAESSD